MALLLLRGRCRCWRRPALLPGPAWARAHPRPGDESLVAGRGLQVTGWRRRGPRSGVGRPRGGVLPPAVRRRAPRRAVRASGRGGPAAGGPCPAVPVNAGASRSPLTRSGADPAVGSVLPRGARPGAMPCLGGREHRRRRRVEGSWGSPPGFVVNWALTSRLGFPGKVSQVWPSPRPVIPARTWGIPCEESSYAAVSREGSVNGFSMTLFVLALCISRVQAPTTLVCAVEVFSPCRSAAGITAGTQLYRRKQRSGFNVLYNLISDRFVVLIGAVKKHWLDYRRWRKDSMGLLCEPCLLSLASV